MRNTESMVSFEIDWDESLKTRVERTTMALFHGTERMVIVWGLPFKILTALSYDIN